MQGIYLGHKQSTLKSQVIEIITPIICKENFQLKKKM